MYILSDRQENVYNDAENRSNFAQISAHVQNTVPNDKNSFGDKLCNGLFCLGFNFMALLTLNFKGAINLSPLKSSGFGLD